jgi:subtilisin family serine protease
MPMLTYFPLILSTATAGEKNMMQMDPRLQRMVLLNRNGVRKIATASTDSDEVAVIAKVSNAQAWVELTEVRSATIITKADNKQDDIVTGRIPIKRVEFIRGLPFVKSLKAAKKLAPTLMATTTEIEAGQLLPAGIKNKTGKGVIVGIIDFGCDFAHQNFSLAKGKSRLLQLWNQGSEKKSPGVQYGTLYSKSDINKALAASNPYTLLQYNPGAKAHGTHVTDIAGGNGRGTKVPGVAPEADIIFVELDSSDVPDFDTASVGKSFGDSVHLLEAIKFIFDKAGNNPCVINLSLGTNGGPHDGSTLVEQGIDSLLAEKPNRAIVIAASNSFEDGIHAAGSVAPKGSVDIAWNVASDDRTENEMEIWFNGKGRLAAEVIDPQGKSLGTVNPGESGTENDNSGNIRMFIANRLDDPNNHDNMIGVWLKQGSTGKWTIRLTNLQNTKTEYHAWIERDDDGQSTFTQPLDNSHTLGSISCSKLTITVGSYDAHKASKPLSWFSSSGPTRDGRQKPEISAPGHDVIAASSRTVNGVTTMSGTSMAAPAVTGAIAVLLGEAKSRNINLTIEAIRKIVIDSARKQPPAKAPDNRYGAGRISLKSMIAALPAAKSGSTKKAKNKKKAAPKKAVKKKRK